MDFNLNAASNSAQVALYAMESRQAGSFALGCPDSFFNPNNASEHEHHNAAKPNDRLIDRRDEWLNNGPFC
ncbi:hypothetical protein KPG66_12605 [Mycetohabitans sp. B2]|uniref:hypothetical protein n=1 Tax=Mycetohabitans sp. B2 TaxID=2841274 RepID=UPI001F1C1A61|nr:hypothetical protein [Mycetohabitans sp. B2]MCF7696900.1 hypothetical protein [Mycetohabitans sp. B2]